MEISESLKDVFLSMWESIF